MNTKLLEQFERVVRADGRYPPEAFEFLQRGLEVAAHARHGPGPSDRGVGHHVTGQELAHGLRILALKSWGPLAREVLRHWNIRRTRDFGEMVYLMIDIGLMGKQDSDDIADFDEVYDFETAFDAYRIDLSSAAADVDACADTQEPLY
jgi:uncharacterized repeat protein (TIGR04138 family)